MNTKELTLVVTTLREELTQAQNTIDAMSRVIVKIQSQMLDAQIADADPMLTRNVANIPTIAPIASARKVTKNDDFLTVVVPYMATRVRENAIAGTDCKTDKLTAIAKDYGCEDFRFFLTPSERSIFKGSRDTAGLTLRQSLVALAGAVERAGGIS